MISTVKKATQVNCGTRSSASAKAETTAGKKSRRTVVQHVPANFTVLMPRRSGRQVDPDSNPTHASRPPLTQPQGLISRLSLTVVSTAQQGRTFQYSVGTSLWVGRGKGAGLRFPHDRKISRKHLQLDIDVDAVRLFDLESLNGTRVNGFPVRVARLQSGDVIEIGRTVLLVHLETR